MQLIEKLKNLEHKNSAHSGESQGSLAGTSAILQETRQINLEVMINRGYALNGK